VYKTELVRRVSRETRLTQRVVSDAVSATLKTIQAALREGQEVRFPGFGSFYTSNRKESRVRHIKTGQPVTIPARRVAGFRAGRFLKRAVRKVAAEKPAPKSREKRSLRGLLKRYAWLTKAGDRSGPRYRAVFRSCGSESLARSKVALDPFTVPAGVLPALVEDLQDLRFEGQ
jgi:DNA-binding protein HU-beta